MYMRLMGYPADKVSIITTYNGQKSLIRDVVEARCANNPLFGRPRDVSTVDKFQGQQNDYILLSLVKTKSVGHIRDIRRLVVAMSRARLGLYVFGRKELFQNCYELSRTFTPLLANKPSNLVLAPHETSLPGSYFPKRQVGETIEQSIEVKDLNHLGQIVHEMSSAAQARYEEYAVKVREFEEKRRLAHEKERQRFEAEEEKRRSLAAEENELIKDIEMGDALQEKLKAVEERVTAGPTGASGSAAVGSENDTNTKE